MYIDDIIEENNAILKVMLKNQALLMVMFDEVVDKLNDQLTFDPVVFEKIRKLRDNLAMALLNILQTEIKVKILEGRQ